ncbi:MAG: (Fe-S)-binding protein [Phycisphaerales bacterium]|nr:(Fe-S)-binding protein [Phycisphaerales bacterium]
MTVHIFIPCFIDQLFPEIGFSMIKVLKKAGCQEVVYNPNQTCCGQPAFNAGFVKEAELVCKKFIGDFSDASMVVVPSASCVGFVRNYYHQMGLKPTFSIFELSDFLVNKMQITDLSAKFEATATYHDSCAGLRECNIFKEPRMLLNQVQGLIIKEMQHTDVCCGFGGSFAVKYDSISVSMADNKITQAMATEAEYVISTDMSCLMHLQHRSMQQKQSLKFIHIAEVLSMGY